VNKKQLDKLEIELKIMRNDFSCLILDKENRKLISKKTKIAESNLCNYAKGVKEISDKKIIEIYKKIL